MPKIFIDKYGNGRVNIPKEIMKIKEWNAETEVLISPLFKEAISEVTQDTPIIITELNTKSRAKK
ncbi:hypothetical protein HYX06_06130 [Candidatus Woesearchaeota archaeon]|nr:hypothetical protein [Candidatus Woesearchaeota archaeon]